MASNPFDLIGRKAMVTGANTGIGQGIAVALARVRVPPALGTRRALRRIRR